MLFSNGNVSMDVLTVRASQGDIGQETYVQVVGRELICGVRLHFFGEGKVWDRSLSDMDLRCVIFSVALLHGTSAVPIHLHPDRVISLPGAPPHPDFNLFSGYLNGSSNATAAPIFYLLAEAIRVDPSTAPLVLWFNGGPGGSSLAGCFKEHGPYRIMEDGSTLTYNEFSWNQYANTLYLESPLGVGFSQNSEGDLTTNDLDAAEINFNALNDFMTRVHPNYANNDYYLSGQSYAGAYVPYLARRLLVGIESGEMKNHKFKGFAIGNPVIHTDGDSMVLAEALQHLNYGVVPLRLSEKVMLNWMKHQRGENLTREDIAEITLFVYSEINSKYIGMNTPVNYNFVEHCYHRPSSYETALHINNFTEGAAKWNSINEPMADHYYHRDYNVLHVYKDLFNMINGSSFRVLIYNGDTDVMISPLLTINGVNSIAEANSLKDQEYDRAWRFYGDFAGIRTGYRNGNVSMDVLTIRGAGHSVPTDLPAQAFQMINNFLFTEENEQIDYSNPIRKHGKE